MRVLLAAAVAILLFSQTVCAQFNRDEFSGAVFLTEEDRSKLYLVRWSLYDEDSIALSEEVAVNNGLSASVICHSQAPFAPWYERPDVSDDSDMPLNDPADLGTFILIETPGCDSAKPEELGDTLWKLVQNSWQTFEFDGLEFHIYSPEADSIMLWVRLLDDAFGSHADGDSSDSCDAAGNESSDEKYVGDLRAPVLCKEISPRMYAFKLEEEVKGTSAKFESEASFVDTGDQLLVHAVSKYRPLKESGLEVPISLVLVTQSELSNEEVAGLATEAITSLLLPPLKTVRIDDFEIHYYCPMADQLTISLWELSGEPVEGWEADATLLGSVSLANSQPLPTYY